MNQPSTTARFLALVSAAELKQCPRRRQQPEPRLFVERAAWNAVLLRPKLIEGYGRQPEIGWLPPRTTGPLDVLRPMPGDGWRGSAVLRLGVHADAMMIDELPAFPAGVEKQQDGGER